MPRPKRIPVVVVNEERGEDPEQGEEGLEGDEREEEPTGDTPPRRAARRSRSRRRSGSGERRSRSGRRRSRSGRRRSRSGRRRSRSDRRRSRSGRRRSRTPSRSRGRARSGSRRRDFETRSRTGSRERSRVHKRRRPDLRDRLEEQRLRLEVLDLKKTVNCLAAKSERPTYPPMTKKNHAEQMKVMVDLRGVAVDEMRAELDRVFPEGRPPTVEEIVVKVEKKINFRCKMIAFADTSSLGWAAANEYACSFGADDEADSRKMEEAEKRAQRKIDKQRKEAEDRQKLERQRHKRSRSKSPAKRASSKIRDTRRCFKCDKEGHLSFSCPSRKR